MDEKRDVVSKAILLASLRLTHDHELGFYEYSDLLYMVNIDYTNELTRLYLYKLEGLDVDRQIDLYMINKKELIDSRLNRLIEKKKRVTNRKEEDWINTEKEYRSEELEHLNILLNFIPNYIVTNLKRANYNDIRLVRNFIRTVNNCNGLLHDDNKINKYRNLELTINNNDYIVIEVIDNYGFIVNKRNWLDVKIIDILDDNININIIDSIDSNLMNKFLNKIQ